jgi:hypothetical protein
VKILFGLCDRFHALPSQVRGESADVLRMAHIEELAGLRQQEGEPEWPTT